MIAEEFEILLFSILKLSFRFIRVYRQRIFKPKVPECLGPMTKEEQRRQETPPPKVLLNRTLKLNQRKEDAKKRWAGKKVITDGGKSEE